VELVRVAARHPDVPSISCLYHIVKGLHGLLDRRVVVKAVALEDVDIVELESLERVLDGFEYMLQNTD
jgi:hypothetical protein